MSGPSNDEEKYRVEPADEHEDRHVPSAFLRPLPEARDQAHTGRTGTPYVRFFGREMPEYRRDLIVALLVPLFAALVDAAVVALVFIEVLDDNALYTFVVPLLAAVPLGLSQERMQFALLSAFLTVLYFGLLMVLFFVSPAFVVPGSNLVEYLTPAFVVSAVYGMFAVVASVLGAFLGMVIREFA